MKILILGAGPCGLVVRFTNIFTKSAVFAILLQFKGGGDHGTKNTTGSTGTL